MTKVTNTKNRFQEVGFFYAIKLTMLFKNFGECFCRNVEEFVAVRIREVLQYNRGLIDHLVGI